jgi:hypothetical protein
MEGNFNTVPCERLLLGSSLFESSVIRVSEGVGPECGSIEMADRPVMCTVFLIR